MADEQDWVYIKHAGIDAIGGPVLRSSFDALWKDKGWTVTEDYELVIDGEGQEKAVPKGKTVSTAKGA